MIEMDLEQKLLGDDKIKHIDWMVLVDYYYD